jgi:hypothetical protein
LRIISVEEAKSDVLGMIKIMFGFMLIKIKNKSSITVQNIANKKNNINENQRINFQ